MQLRDFLQRSLYDPEQGYFISPSAGVPVGSIGQPLEFKNLLGQADYLANVKERYIQLQVMHSSPAIVVCRVILKAAGEQAGHCENQLRYHSLCRHLG